MKVRPGKSTAVLGGDIRIFYVIIITCPASLDNSIINSQNNNNNIHYITQGTQVDYDVPSKLFRIYGKPFCVNKFTEDRVFLY